MAVASVAGDDDVRQPTDSGLVARARLGDADALDLLLVPRLEWALRLTRRLTTDQHDAEDLLQDACLRAIDQLDHFPAGGRFDPWFARMIYNLAFNRRKAARVRAVEPLDDQLAAGGDDPLRNTIAGEIQERFARAVATLPDRQRVVVMMFEVEGYASVEIAEALGVSAETVRWHLHAARKTLRAVLQFMAPTDEHNAEGV